jgi:hypothetical protein
MEFAALREAEDGPSRHLAAANNNVAIGVSLCENAFGYLIRAV